jgi:hypothetical protein
MMINATFDNISAISWWSVLLREKTRVLGESHPHWPTDKLYRIMLYRVHDVELTSVLLSVGIEVSSILLEGSLKFWTYLDFCLSFSPCLSAYDVIFVSKSISKNKIILCCGLCVRNIKFNFENNLSEKHELIVWYLTARLFVPRMRMGTNEK